MESANSIRPDLQSTASKMTEPLLDRWAQRMERALAFYSERQDQLFRPFLDLSLMSYFFSICWTLSAVNFELLALRGSVVAYRYLVLSIVYRLFMIFLALAVRSRLSKQKSTAITIFASLLVLNLFGLHLILFLIGLYVGLNSAFRSHAAEWAPDWYKKICVSIST